MPRDFITLADVREPALTIVREHRADAEDATMSSASSPRNGTNMRLPELLTVLADCSKARAFSIHDRCKANYEQRPRPAAGLQSAIGRGYCTITLGGSPRLRRQGPA
jgi:hypothetical protein